jgi:hypothetical protein
MQPGRKTAPDLQTAALYYPKVLNEILAYAEFCDEHGDEDLTEYKKMESRLHQLTGKDMSAFNLSEWWEEEGAEPLAFKISLPGPVKMDDLSKDDLQEVVSRLKNIEPPPEDDSFYARFYYFMDDYYHALLALNFKTYDVRLFQRNKDKSGNYFEYSIAEIAAKLWDNG